MPDNTRLLPALAAPDFERSLHTLNILARRPPQVLLLEGGTERQRMDMGLYWAMSANCPDFISGNAAAPCLACPVCRQTAAGELLDLWLYDGRISNTLDEEKPGIIRAMSMDNIRALKSSLGAAPHGAGKRVAIFQGLIPSREEAMNSLLKILEEPSATTLFVLLTPQRQRILPTLVSRSFCLTLPWPDSGAQDASLAVWEQSLAEFLMRGNGFLDKIAAKGAVDPTLAEGIILACQKSLARILGGRGEKLSPLDGVLATLAQKPARAARLCLWFAEAQEMLRDTVNPTRALEAFSCRLYSLLREAA